MNLPNVYKKVADGFIIPPRTFTQMLSSAVQGAFSLVFEPDRQDYLDKSSEGIINEGVLKQAHMGNLVLLSLFNDLRNPLFQVHGFEPKGFLEGVAPALENFHNVLGLLENEFHQIKHRTKKTDDAGEEKNETEEGHPNENADEEKESVLSAFREYSGPEFAHTGIDANQVEAILKYQWMEDAKSNPDSLAGQLSRMVTRELFQLHEVSSKSSFLLQNHNSNILFEPGSSTVNNVALLSARTCLCLPADGDGQDANQREDVSEDPKPNYQVIDYDIDEEDFEKRKVGVAAQLEVLYDVTRSFESDGEDAEDTNTQLEGDDSESNPMSTTIVSVATIEGWLKGGPEGELRWRLTRNRPAFEFPGIQHSY